jgi:hypothetical protein
LLGIVISSIALNSFALPVRISTAAAT